MHNGQSMHNQGRIQDLAMGGGKISREAIYIYERSELRAKRVTSEASINQLGDWDFF